MGITRDSDALPERVILGHLLLVGEDSDRSDVIERIVPRIGGHTWSKPGYQAVWDAITTLHRGQRPFGETTVRDHLTRQPGPDLTRRELTELTSEALAVANIEAHVDALIAEDETRRFSKLVHDAARRIDAGESPIDVITHLAQVADDASLDLSDHDLEFAVETAATAAEKIERAQRGENPVAIPSGWANFDEEFHGFRRKQLAVLAARPGVGKTVCGVEFAVNAAKQGYGVYVASLEQPRDEIFTRIISAQTGVPYHLLISGRSFSTDPHEHDALLDKVVDVMPYANLPLFVDDQAYRISEIRRNLGRANRMLSKLHNTNTTGVIDLVVIDYSLWVRPEKGAPPVDRRLEIEAVTKGCIRIAHEFNAAVILLTQVRRDGAERMPRAEDLKESGSLEQDADLIIALHRPALTTKDATDPIHFDPTLEVGIIKNRHGPTDTIKRNFDGKYMRTLPHDERLRSTMPMG